MDYHKIYIELMERAADRIIDGYTEKHHIVPKCMGGDDKPRNIAILTPEEHFLAHQLLSKMYPKHRGLTYAAMLMTTDCKGNRVNNKLYGWIKQRLSDVSKGIPSPKKGKKVGLKGKFKSDGFLTMEDANEIRRLKFSIGRSVKYIANKFNVKEMVVYRIINNKTYTE